MMNGRMHGGGLTLHRRVLYVHEVVTHYTHRMEDLA